jgi:hypothetical protein
MSVADVARHEWMATIGESAKAADGGAMTPSRRRNLVGIAGKRFAALGWASVFVFSSKN